MSIFTNWIKKIAMKKVEPYFWLVFVAGFVCGLVFFAIVRICLWVQ